MSQDVALPINLVNLAVPDSTDRVDEKVILQRIAAGDPDALADWFLRHKDGLYSFVYYRVGNDPDLAADATQATFVKALERLADFDPRRGEMKTWLRFLSRNIVREMLGRNHRGVQLQAAWDQLDETLRQAYAKIDSQLLPEAVLEREETRELVETTLANLPANYREVLEAKYIENETLDTIATLRETTVDGVKSMLQRARAAFRECFLALAKMEMSDV